MPACFEDCGQIIFMAAQNTKNPTNRSNETKNQEKYYSRPKNTSHLITSESEQQASASY